MLPDTVPADPQRRFSAVARLYGTEGAARIGAAHVAVIGVGGVGSWAAEALARTGVGRITVVDMDHVAESNINRQIHATSATLGQAKVQAMQARIQSIHPQCQVQMVDDFVTPENWPALLPELPDAVIDACDQRAAKTVMALWALRNKRTAFIMAGAAGGKQCAHRMEVDDLAAVTHDPLLAKIRYMLRRNHSARGSAQKIGLTCVFSREPVTRPQTSACASGIEHNLNCHGYGSSVSVTASFGMAAAGWIVKKLAEGTK